jgi:tagatose-1,6-bisphosphate aldolase non-catalytic subunit AgaZ/GatZ
MPSPPNSAPSPRLFFGLEGPRPLRALVRARESSLAILGVVVGALAGVVVVVMSSGVTMLHEAVVAFDQTEAEALAIIQSRESRHVIGLLSEAHALRRYSEELELRRRELIGE